MKSLRELYRIGLGPSSSHTMGPRFAAQSFRAALPDAAARVRVTLYGSLAAGFRLSRHYACSGGDTACVARAIDSYCLDQADQQNLAWQHCAAGLVWFIGTSSGGQ